MKRCLGFVCRWIVTSVTSASLLLIMPVTNIAASTEQEKAWWHGTFILAGSGQFGCSDNDIRLALVPELVEVLEGGPRTIMLFLTHGKQGKGYSPGGFGNWFKDQCRAAGLPQCCAHGLRKAGATRLANAGATEFEIMAFMGHNTPHEARTYVKAANRLTLIDSALEKHQNVSNPVTRLDISIRKGLKNEGK